MGLVTTRMKIPGSRTAFRSRLIGFCASVHSSHLKIFKSGEMPFVERSYRDDMSQQSSVVGIFLDSFSSNAAGWPPTCHSSMLQLRHDSLCSIMRVYNKSYQTSPTDARVPSWLRNSRISLLQRAHCKRAKSITSIQAGTAFQKHFDLEKCCQLRSRHFV